MGAALSQSEQARFADRGEMGLRVSLSAGLGGAYVTHDVGQAMDRVHVRVLVHGEAAAGGAVRIAGGQDDAGDASWWLDYDADERRVSLELAGGGSLEAGLNGLAWQCVEVMVDASGEAALWVNGLMREMVTGLGAVAATRAVWLGAVFKEADLAGALYLNEWVIDEQWIGPAVVGAAGEHADDPRRWLVLYNREVDESVAWVEWYREQRGVPYANLLGLALSTQETIDGQGYAELAGQVNDYLEQTGLGEQVMGIVAGYRVPGYVDFFDDPWLKRAVADLLHSESETWDVVFSELAADALPGERLAHAGLNGLRLTARIDGPTLADAKALTERAQALEANSLEGAGARLWVDYFVDREIAPETWSLRDWSSSVDRMHTRMRMELAGDADEPGEDASFESIHDDAFFIGFGPKDVPTSFFAEPAGARVLCAQLELVEGTGTSARGVVPSNWLESAMEAGYAAVVSASRAYSPTGSPYARPMFESMRRGWTLGEAWLLAQPMLREGLFLTGDPLMRVNLPRAGWDVYGPASRLEAMDFDRPTVALGAGDGEVELVDALEPTGEGASVYVVHRVNEQGYSDGALRVMRARMLDGQARVVGVRQPVWPADRDWPVRVRENQVRVRVMWECMLREAGVARVELMVEADGEAESVAQAWEVDDTNASERGIDAVVGMPVEWARYRWRVVGESGASVVTPWSAVVQAESVEGELTLL